MNYTFGSVYKLHTIWSDDSGWREVRLPFDTGAEGVAAIQAHLAEGARALTTGLEFGLYDAEESYDFGDMDMPDWIKTLPPDDAGNRLVSPEGHRQFLTAWWDAHEGLDEDKDLEEHLSKVCTIIFGTMHEDDPDYTLYCFTIVPETYRQNDRTGTFSDLVWRDYGGENSNWEVAEVDRHITGPDGTCDPIYDPIFMTDPKIGDHWLHYKNTPICMQKDTARSMRAGGHTRHLNSFPLP